MGWEVTEGWVASQLDCNWIGKFRTLISCVRACLIIRLYKPLLPQTSSFLAPPLFITAKTNTRHLFNIFHHHTYNFTKNLPCTDFHQLQDSSTWLSVSRCGFHKFSFADWRYIISCLNFSPLTCRRFILGSSPGCWPLPSFGHPNVVVCLIPITCPVWWFRPEIFLVVPFFQLSMLSCGPLFPITSPCLVLILYILLCGSLISISGFSLVVFLFREWVLSLWSSLFWSSGDIWWYEILQPRWTVINSSPFLFIQVRKHVCSITTTKATSQDV